jgi:hypothetical protein
MVEKFIAHSTNYNAHLALDIKHIPFMDTYFPQLLLSKNLSNHLENLEERTTFRIPTTNRPQF